MHMSFEALKSIQFTFRQQTLRTRAGRGWRLSNWSLIGTLASQDPNDCISESCALAACPGIPANRTITKARIKTAAQAKEASLVSRFPLVFDQLTRGFPVLIFWSIYDHIFFGWKLDFRPGRQFLRSTTSFSLSVQDWNYLWCRVITVTTTFGVTTCATTRNETYVREGH